MIKFSSKAAGDIFMLDDHGRQLLDLIGKGGRSQGVITAEELEGALSRLRSAIERENEAGPAGGDTDDAVVNEDVVALKRRAFPLMDMLERAQRKRTEVAWGI